jgi:hypothetical protein
MSRRFKGTTIQLDAPERLLPTESTGIDLREARSMNRPPRDFGDSRPPRREFGSDDRFPRRDFGAEDRLPRREFGYDDRAPRRDFGSDDRPVRRFDRDGDDGPRRTISRKTDDSAPVESDDDWRSGPSRTTTAPRRFGGADTAERRPAPRREESTAADIEDDWRTGSAPTTRPSAFGDRRVPSRREDEEEGPVRRFSSRKIEESRADDDDWRRTGKEETPAPRDRIERTRSSKPATRADEEDDWRAIRSTPRRTANVEETPSRRERQAGYEEVRKTPSTAQPKKIVQEEEKWSSDEEEIEEAIVQEAKPDREKISKFASKVGQYIEVSATEDVVKKIDSVTKKIPVNFSKAELVSIEPARAVLGLVLNTDTLTSEKEIVRLVGLIAPILLCLEEEFISFGGSAEDFQLNIVEEVQKFVSSNGCPRLNPEEALVELIWLGLYETHVVCEETFAKWLEVDTFESPNKSTTMFQTEAFRAWLYEFELPGVEATLKKSAFVDKDEWSSDDDSDIEALVPKRLSAAHVRAGHIAPLRR